MDLPAAPGPPVLPSPQPRGLPPRRSRSRRDLALLVIMLAALLAAASRGYLGSQDAQASALRETALIPGKISFFFSALDVNRDMYISPKEFKPIAEIMRGSVVKPITDFEKTEELKEETSSQEEELAIVTPFEPLLLDTTSNSKTGFKEVIIHRLVSVFHPRPFVKTHYGPKGTVACLTANSDSYYTVACSHRIRAKFQLNQPLYFPFWFCPGQFTQHIIFSKNCGHVQEFSFLYPKKEEVVQFEREDMLRQQELSMEETGQQLERAMYPFKENQKNGFYKDVAEMHLKKYNFPVESLVCPPNRTVVYGINANQFFFKAPQRNKENEIFNLFYSIPTKSPEIYEEFLREGLHRAQAFLQP